MIYPIDKKRPESIFDQNLPLALPKEIRLPSMSVTLIPKAILPRVPCFEEDSRRAKYSHVITIEIRAVNDINPIKEAIAPKAISSFTDVDDKAVEVFIKTFKLEEESK